MDATNSSYLNFGSTFGAMYIGAMVMTTLYGITCVQTYLAFIRYPSDTLSNRCLIALLWLLDTSHVCLVAHALYQYLVVNHSNSTGLVNGIWSLYLSLAINVLIAFVVQCFFVTRIHDLSGKNWWITLLLINLVVLHLAFGLVTISEFYKLQRLDSFTKIIYFALPFAIFAILSDIGITIALCWLLHANKTDYEATNELINHLILYAINRCVLALAMSILEVVFFIVLPGSFWFLAIDFIAGKCYANSLLASLNSRASLRSKALDIENSPVRFSTVMGISRVTVNRPTSQAPNTSGSLPEIETDSGRTSESSDLHTNESVGEETVKRVSRIPSRPVTMTQVEQLSARRFSINRLSANIGARDFPSPPVREEVDISDSSPLETPTPSTKEHASNSWIFIDSPSGGSLDLDIDDFFSVHEADK